MKLEKATSHSSDASLAGWISSNDVTLLTMVLVVMIALFLHSKLVKGAKENAALVGERTTLSATLESTQDELDRNRLELRGTGDKLRLTEEQRNKLDDDLRTALGSINDLNDRMSKLTAAKSQVEQQQNSLIEATELLTDERNQLTRQQQSLTQTRDALSKDKVSLAAQLTQIADQLAAKLRLLEDAEQQRNRLEQQANELESIVAGLTAKLEAADLNVADLKKQSEAARGESMARIQSLEGKLTTGNVQAEEYLVQLKRATEALKRLNLEKQQIASDLDRAQQQRYLALARDTQVNRELVGLEGKLKKVVVLFDASGSMNAQSPDGQSSRWAEAKRIVATWLRRLDVDECALIVFSDDVRSFPQGGSFARLRGEHGESERVRLLQMLDTIEPKGWTNTLGALRKAYEYREVDTMILFSDGAPTNVNLGRFDAAVADEIYQLCRRHASIPVNTIGLGNYFERDLGNFLRTVAGITGGTFQGR